MKKRHRQRKASEFEALLFLRTFFRELRQKFFLANLMELENQNRLTRLVILMELKTDK